MRTDKAAEKMVYLHSMIDVLKDDDIDAVIQFIIEEFCPKGKHASRECKSSPKNCTLCWKQNRSVTELDRWL